MKGAKYQGNNFVNAISAVHHRIVQPEWHAAKFQGFLFLYRLQW